jgi:hypothetical protein
VTLRPPPARLISGAIVLPLLAMAVFAGHSLTLRCRWTGQAMQLERCCPKPAQRSPDGATPAWQREQCCSLERGDVESTPSEIVVAQADRGCALPVPEVTATPAAPATTPTRLLVVATPRPPPLAARLALKHSRLI